MDYRHQLEIVKELQVEGTRRLDCPFCLNRNTFDITNKDGVLMWNCFHASCTAKGSSGSKFSREDVENFMSQKKQLHNHKFVQSLHNEFEHHLHYALQWELMMVYLNYFLIPMQV